MRSTWKRLLTHWLRCSRQLLPRRLRRLAVVMAPLGPPLVLWLNLPPLRQRLRSPLGAGLRVPAHRSVCSTSLAIRTRMFSPLWRATGMCAEAIQNHEPDGPCLLGAARARGGHAPRLVCTVPPRPLHCCTIPPRRYAAPLQPQIAAAPRRRLCYRTPLSRARRWGWHGSTLTPATAAC